jgi:uncharacterized protein YecT (DUF1311 family)
MRFSRIAILAPVFAVLAGGAFADECRVGTGEAADQVACAEQMWKETDETLYGAFRSALEAAAALDAHLPETGVAATDLLENGQEQWAQYRDITCEAEQLAMRDETAGPLLYWGCMSRLARHRIRELEYLANIYK